MSYEVISRDKTVHNSVFKNQNTFGLTTRRLEKFRSLIDYRYACGKSQNQQRYRRCNVFGKSRRQKGKGVKL